jgi:putative two-component system response regulator
MLLQRILVVDDEEPYRQLLEKFLQTMGYSCDVAASAHEAAERLQAQKFDLVISDIRMKGKDGVQLMMETKKSLPQLHFIIMTGHAADYTYQEIIGAGAADYITKPFEMGELKAKLERIGRERMIMEQLEAANEELKQAYDKLRKTLQQTVNVLGSTVEMRDRYTAGHQMRVANLASAIGRELGLSSQIIDGIRLAGLIHDIGKVAVPAEILSKPDVLSDLEMRLIKEHPRVGYEILKGVEFPWPIAEIILQHHERLDGTGYPQGLKGHEIIQEAQILAVADVVEAMASHRPYRPSLGLDKAIEEITRHRGVRYSPEAVDACVRLIEQKRFLLD